MAGSRRVADVGAWRLSRQPEGDDWEIEIEPKDADAYWWGAAPVTLALDLGPRRWAWTLASGLPPIDRRVKLVLQGLPETSSVFV